MAEYRLPDGSVPVLLSSDSVDGLRAEAAALRDYVAAHPEVTPERLADMLFRTRTARRRRVLILASPSLADPDAGAGRAAAPSAGATDELRSALDAIATGSEHALVVHGDVPASARRVGFVFPGQGSQRPGMGATFYELSADYRAVVDECAAIHAERRALPAAALSARPRGAVRGHGVGSAARVDVPHDGPGRAVASGGCGSARDRRPQPG